MTMTASRETAVTHPKIRERRAAVEDQKLRSRNRKLLAGVVVVLIALLAAAATQSPLLDVDEVRVIGAVRVTSDSVREIAAIETGEPLLGLDLRAAQERLEGEPAIASATATKEWDGTVTIEILERRPVAVFNVEDGVVGAAADGIIVEVTDAAAGELPLISGAMFLADPGVRVPKAVDDALIVAAELPPDIARLTERIEVSVDMLSLRLRGGAQVELGDARNLDLKIDAIRAFFAQVELDCLERLNVQAPTVPVLVRLASCS